MFFLLNFECDRLVILEKRHGNQCADKRCQHVHPDALRAHVRQVVIIVEGYLVDSLGEAKGRVQAGSRPKGEVVAHAEDIGQTQTFQEEVRSDRIFILALGQHQIDQSEKASLQNFLAKNSGELEPNRSRTVCVYIETGHRNSIWIKLIAG